MKVMHKQYIAVSKIIEAAMTNDLNVKMQACTTVRAAVYQQLLEPERSREVCLNILFTSWSHSVAEMKRD